MYLQFPGADALYPWFGVHPTGLFCMVLFINYLIPGADAPDPQVRGEPDPGIFINYPSGTARPDG